MKCSIFISVLLLLLCFIAVGAKTDSGEKVLVVDESLVARKILKLHEAQGPAKKNIVWGECGKRLRGEIAVQRAGEYATAVKTSVEAVYDRTGEWIDYRHVIAILYRESSNDECVIGRQETAKLRKQLKREPRKREFVGHVKKWQKAYREARIWCRKYRNRKDCANLCVETTRGKDCGGERWCRKMTGPSGCAQRYVDKFFPEYRGIHGWDIGAAQYRWPRGSFSKRKIAMPDGRQLDGVKLDDFMSYDVAIHMLVEDLVGYKKACRRHRHYRLNRTGKRMRRLGAEEAYFAHHHTGSHRWSHRYWKAVNRHLRVIDSPDDGDELMAILMPRLFTY